MRNKIIMLLIVMLLFLTSFPLIVSGGSEDDPEIEDRVFDVRFLGSFPFFPQTNFRTADFTSAWFYEREDQPDNLYVCMKTRALKTSTATYECIYIVRWTYMNVHYGISLHLLPNKSPIFFAGSLDKGLNDYIDCVICDGTIDEENNIVTWVVPKSGIGNPVAKMKISNIQPLTNIRFPLDSGKVKFDLFKDLSRNAKVTKDYALKY
jgi:hypothetical protein